MKQQNELLANLSSRPPAAPHDHSVTTELSTTVTPIAAPSKLELARQWLREHPDDAKRSDRWLERHAKPQNVRISRTWWNKAKKEFLTS